MDDDDMSLSDDDGGVRLDLDFEPDESATSKQLAIVHHNPQQPSDESELRVLQEADSTYHQTQPNLVDPLENLWRLPVAPAMELKGLSKVAWVYHKSCQVIQKNWKCSPEDGMPEILQSLRDRTHATLVDQWRARLTADGNDYNAVQDKREMVLCDTFGSNPNSLEHCEILIQENKYGLTLEDVAKTAEIVRMSHKEDLRKRKQENKIKQKAAKETPTKVKKSKRNKAARLFPPVEEISTKNILSLDSVRLARLAAKVGGLTLQEDTGDELVAIEYGTEGVGVSPPGQMPDPNGKDATQAKLTRSEKDTVQEIAQQLGAVRLQDRRQKGGKRRRKGASQAV